MGLLERQVRRDPRDHLAPKDLPVTRVHSDPMDSMEEVVTQETLDHKALL